MIAEFETTEAAKAAFISDAYKAAFKLLGDVERDVRIIEGFGMRRQTTRLFTLFSKGFAWFVEKLERHNKYD